MRDGITVTSFAPAGEPRKCLAIAHPDTSLPSINSMERMCANATLMALSPELFEAVLQYRDDLKYPLDAESTERRREWVEALVARATGAA